MMDVMSPSRLQIAETTIATITSKIYAFWEKSKSESTTRGGSPISHQVIEMSRISESEQETEIVSDSHELKKNIKWNLSSPAPGSRYFLDKKEVTTSYLATVQKNLENLIHKLSNKNKMPKTKNPVKAQKNEDLTRARVASESDTITAKKNELNKVKSSVTRSAENILQLKQQTAQAANEVKKNRRIKAMLKIEQEYLTQEIKIIEQGIQVEDKGKLSKIRYILSHCIDEIQVTDECWKELRSEWESLTAELQTQEKRYSDLLEILILLCCSIADGIISVKL
jgi:hypothetical protein